jgi:formylglycine-generating enzyme required for sulfatase activity
MVMRRPQHVLSHHDPDSLAHDSFKGVRFAYVLGCTALLLATLHCGALVGINGLVADLADGAGDSGDGGDGGEAREAGVGPSTCSSTCGTPGCGTCPAAPVPVTSVSKPFTMDAHEVTVAEYLAWLAANPSTSGQRSECAWNDSYEPNQPSPAVTSFLDGGMPNKELCQKWNMRGDHKPITCVDWCDAAAYCAWAKGRLCGRIGGGSVDVTTGTAYADATQSEWYAACSSGGTRAYPYGQSYTAGACNDDGMDTADVGSLPTCQGGVAGLFDMSGNVGEWTDECTTYNSLPLAQNCTRRGGAYWGTPTELMCDAKFVDFRGRLDPALGFRCCGTL